jgi:hypothetical protein
MKLKNSEVDTYEFFTSFRQNFDLNHSKHRKYDIIIKMEI